MPAKQSVHLFSLRAQSQTAAVDRWFRLLLNGGRENHILSTGLRKKLFFGGKMVLRVRRRVLTAVPRLQPCCLDGFQTVSVACKRTLAFKWVTNPRPFRTRCHKETCLRVFTYLFFYIIVSSSIALSHTSSSCPPSSSALFVLRALRPSPPRSSLLLTTAFSQRARLCQIRQQGQEVS